MAADLNAVHGDLLSLADVEKLIIHCTDDMSDTADWASFIRICDIINANAHRVKQVVKFIQKRLGKKEANTQFLSLELTETVVKNCTVSHPVIGAADFQKALIKLLSNKKTADKVVEKGLTMVQIWKQAFKDFDPRIYKFTSTYDELVRKGAMFPALNANEQVPVFTPPAAYNLRDSGVFEDQIGMDDYYSESGSSVGGVPIEVGDLPQGPFGERERARGNSQLAYVQGVPPQSGLAAANAPVPASIDSEAVANQVSLLREMLINVDLSELPNGRLGSDELIDELVAGVKRIQPRLQNAVAAAVESGDGERMETLLVQNDAVVEVLEMYERLRQGIAADDTKGVVASASGVQQSAFAENLGHDTGEDILYEALPADYERDSTVASNNIDQFLSGALENVQVSSSSSAAAPAPSALDPFTAHAPSAPSASPVKHRRKKNAGAARSRKVRPASGSAPAVAADPKPPTVPDDEFDAFFSSRKEEVKVKEPPPSLLDL